MKRKLLILSLATLFLTGCAGMSLKDNTTQVAVKGTASTLGYFIGQNNIDRIPEWNSWVIKVLDVQAGDTVISFEKILAQGYELVNDLGFLKLKFDELISLFEFPNLQPPDLPFLKAEYLEMVKIALGGFRDGLMAAKAEAEN